MDCLEHYNCVAFQNDYQHLQHCHIEPIQEATKNNMEVIMDEDDEDDTDDDEEEDDDSDNKEDNEHIASPKKYKVILDKENRNIYEWFEDNLGECDAEKCAIFDRTYRSRYDNGFEKKSDDYFVLNVKERQDWTQTAAEIQYQRVFDAIHTVLFHSMARYDCMGLGTFHIKS